MCCKHPEFVYSPLQTNPSSLPSCFVVVFHDLRAPGDPVLRPIAGFALATGWQPGALGENSDGKSYIKIWILQGGVQGEPPLPGPCTPPLRSRFLYRIFHQNFPNRKTVKKSQKLRKLIKPKENQQKHWI